MKKILLLLVLLALFQISYSKEINVNTFEDEVDANPGDGKCETQAGKCTFRAAVMEANSLTGTDKILLPEGTFTLIRARINDEGDFGLDASGGDLDILDSIEIIGSGIDKTIINNAILRDRAINFVTNKNNPMTLKLSGVTFISPVLSMHGSAFNLEYVDADIDNIKITNGSSGTRVIRVRKGSLHINNSHFVISVEYLHIDSRFGGVHRGNFAPFQSISKRGKRSLLLFGCGHLFRAYIFVKLFGAQ